jgi:hypothetical protein
MTRGRKIRLKPAPLHRPDGLSVAASCWALLLRIFASLCTKLAAEAPVTRLRQGEARHRCPSFASFDAAVLSLRKARFARWAFEKRVHFHTTRAPGRSSPSALRGVRRRTTTGARGRRVTVGDTHLPNRGRMMGSVTPAGGEHRPGRSWHSRCAISA